MWGRTVGYLSDNLASCVSYLIIFVPRKFDRTWITVALFALKTISPYKLWPNERFVRCDWENMQITQRLRFCWWNVFNGKCTFLRGSFLYVSNRSTFHESVRKRTIILVSSQWLAPLNYWIICFTFAPVQVLSPTSVNLKFLQLSDFEKFKEQHSSCIVVV